MPIEETAAPGPGLGTRLWPPLVLLPLGHFLAFGLYHIQGRPRLISNSAQFQFRAF